MSSLEKKKVGRPKVSADANFEHLQDIWLQVEVLREEIKSKTGRRLSVSRACETLAQRGGLIWIVAGDVDAIAREMANNKKPPVSSWRRVNLTKKGKGFRLRTSKRGRVVVSRKAQHGKSIRARYVQANETFKNSPHVQEAWNNYLCDMLGRPRPRNALIYGVRHLCGPSPRPFNCATI